MIPINISTPKSPNAYSGVLDQMEKEIVLENVAPEDWVKINPCTIGYYRTQYPNEMLEKLIPAIRDMTLPPLDRLGIIDDLFSLVQAGQTQV
jgi:puromycin-sensitive aminopeptidase